MDVKDLRCFLAVAEKLNFSRAAESLYMSQPALSLRINALEQALGTALFRRTHQHVYLTAAGSAMLPEVQDLLARFDGLPQVARNGENFALGDGGAISFGLDVTLPWTINDMLKDDFFGICEDYPNLQVTVNTVEYRRYKTALSNREFDICLVGFEGGTRYDLPPRFNTVCIAADEMVLVYAGDGSEDPWALIRERELLLLDGDRWNSVILNYLDSKNIRARVRLLNDGLCLHISLMRRDTVTYMPMSFFKSMGDERLRCLKLPIPESYVALCLVWDRSNFNPAIQLFINRFPPAETGGAL